MATDESVVDIVAEMAYQYLCRYLRPSRTPIDFELLADKEQAAWRLAVIETTARIEENE